MRIIDCLQNSFFHLSVYTRWAWNAAKWLGIQCWHVPSASSPHESEKESGSFLTTRSMKSDTHTYTCTHCHVCTRTSISNSMSHNPPHFPHSVSPSFQLLTAVLWLHMYIKILRHQHLLVGVITQLHQFWHYRALDWRIAILLLWSCVWLLISEFWFCLYSPVCWSHDPACLWSSLCIMFCSCSPSFNNIKMRI